MLPDVDFTSCFRTNTPLSFAEVVATIEQIQEEKYVMQKAA
jgi:hypothetical protein